jgi:hypothetical protein
VWGLPPELRILAYEERKPMLRVVRLPEATVEPAPVSLDTGYALDHCFRREGWIAFRPNVDAWGLPVPFGAPPFLIARDAHVVCAGLDPKTVWLRGRDDSSIAAYDGVVHEIARRVDLPDDFPAQEFYVVAETAAGFLLGRGYDGGLYRWEPGEQPTLLLDQVQPRAVDPIGTTVLCWRHSSEEIVLFDLRQVAQVAVPKAAEARWPFHQFAFSPDGAWLAVDLDCSIERTEEQMFARLREVASGGGRYEPQAHRLGIIRCADGAMTVAEGEYDNFANLVWSLDSEWIVFSTLSRREACGRSDRPRPSSNRSSSSGTHPRCSATYPTCSPNRDTRRNSGRLGECSGPPTG